MASNHQTTCKTKQRNNRQLIYSSSSITRRAHQTRSITAHIVGVYLNITSKRFKVPIGPSSIKPCIPSTSREFRWPPPRHFYRPTIPRSATGTFPTCTVDVSGKKRIISGMKMGSRKPLVDDEQQQRQEKKRKKEKEKGDFRSRLMQEPCRHVGPAVVLSPPFLSPVIYCTQRSQPVIYIHIQRLHIALYRALNQHHRHHLFGEGFSGWPTNVYGCHHQTSI